MMCDSMSAYYWLPGLYIQISAEITVESVSPWNSSAMGVSYWFTISHNVRQLHKPRRHVIVTILFIMKLAPLKTVVLVSRTLCSRQDDDRSSDDVRDNEDVNRFNAISCTHWPHIEHTAPLHINNNTQPRVRFCRETAILFWFISLLCLFVYLTRTELLF